MKSTFKAGQKLLNPPEKDALDEDQVTYQCGDPFVKLRLIKSDVTTDPSEMKQFEFDLETLFKFEILLSPERFQSKRDTLSMVGLLQAFGAFRGAMTLVGTQFVGAYSATNFKNEMSRTFARGNKNVAVGNFMEVIMMTYLWGCCLKQSSRFKNLQASQAKVSKTLDIRKLFDEYDELEASHAG